MTVPSSPAPGRAFWLDVEYDEGNAMQHGGSRYGDYIRHQADWFDQCWDWENASPARFAGAAWRKAAPPVMVPGYVRCHPKILAAQLEQSGYDGSLLVCVQLITPWPEALSRSLDWRGGKAWQDWPTPAAVGEGYYEPDPDQLATAPYALSSTTLRFQIPENRLPEPPPDRPPAADLVSAAKRHVAAVLTELNRTVSPVLTTLEHA